VRRSGRDQLVGDVLVDALVPESRPEALNGSSAAAYRADLPAGSQVRLNPVKEARRPPARRGEIERPFAAWSSKPLAVGAVFPPHFDDAEVLRGPSLELEHELVRRRRERAAFG